MSSNKHTSSARESPPSKKKKGISLVESSYSCVSCSKDVEEDVSGAVDENIVNVLD